MFNWYRFHFIIFLLLTFFLSSCEARQVAKTPQSSEKRLTYSKLKAYLANINRGLDYLKANDLCPTLNDPRKVKEITNLLIQIRQKENQFPEKYQVVTAQDSRFFAYQVIAKELYKQQQGQERQNFEFLRYPGRQLVKDRQALFKTFPTLNVNKDNMQIVQVLADELSRKNVDRGIDNTDDAEDIYSINDTKPEISKQIVAINLGLETCLAYDSALFVFLDGKGVVEGHKSSDNEAYIETFKSYLRQVFQSAGIHPEAYEKYLTALIYNTPITPEGIINQIFVPKSRIKEFLYISLPGGFLNVVSDELIDHQFETFQQERLSSDFDIHFNLQGRLIAGKLFDKDVEIFRYTLIPIKDQEIYSQFVQEVIEAILIENEALKLEAA